MLNWYIYHFVMEYHSVQLKDIWVTELGLILVRQSKIAKLNTERARCTLRSGHTVLQLHLVN